MVQADRKKRLDILIEHQAHAIAMAARQQVRLAQYHNGRLSADDEKISLIVGGQQELLKTAQALNDAIIGTLKTKEAQIAEVDSFLAELDVLDVHLSDRDAWRRLVIDADDWRAAAAQNGLDQGISMHWARPDVENVEALLLLVELLDRYGFGRDERRSVLTHVRMSSS
jgi:hypothetical protein